LFYSQINNKIFTHNIRVIYFDSKNTIWLGTDKGLFNIDKHKVKYYSTKNGLKDNSIISVVEDSSGILWVGTDKGISGIVLNRNRRNELLNHVNLICKILPEQRARSLFVDRNNDLWVGFLYYGLYKVSGDSIINLNGKNKVYADNIRYIFKDDAGKIWIATRYHGVFVYSNNKIKHYGIEDGLGSDWVSTITEDRNKNFWFCTARGVTRYDGKVWRTYDENDGATSGEVTAAAVDKQGNIWFGSYSGIFKYIDTSGNSPHLAPKVYIKQIEVNGNMNTNFSMSSITTLPYDKNNIAFEFAGIWFKNESEIFYKYRLQGLDDKWSNLVKSNNIRFQNLPPGKYNFEVAAKNNGGYWSANPAEVAFIIQPPVWKTWWFQSLAIIFLIGLLIVIYRYRIKHVLEVERLRTKIASDLHDDVGTTLSRISLISQLIKENIEPEKIKDNLNDIGMLCRDALTTMSDIVWSMDSRNDNIQSMINRIKDSCSSILPAAEIKYSFNIEIIDQNKTIKAELRKNIYLIAKEALNNIINHSNASNVKIEIKNDGDIFSMIISDDGNWEKSISKLTGHGIRNMKTRAEEIGGHVEIKNNAGTTIVFTAKAI
jgi:two-component sensor histidine kinase/streptogramin lyase